MRWILEKGLNGQQNMGWHAWLGSECILVIWWVEIPPIDRAARIKPIYSCAFTCTWSCMRTNFFYNSPGLLYLNPGALLHRPLFRITRTRKPWESALQVTAVLERIANAFSTFLSRMVPLITRTFLYPRLSALFYSEHNFDFCSGSRRRRPSALATGTFPLNFFRKGKKLFIMEGIITFLLKLIPLTSRASYTRLLKLFWFWEGRQCNLAPLFLFIQICRYSVIEKVDAVV